MDADQAAALRAPFDQAQIGYIPKGGVQLAYVGHAHVCDRLLSVDPDWWWEPMGVDVYGLPVLDDSHNLWIKLHILDTVTLGVGDGPSMKERIGDAIRNAAMRRGVALDLWAKDTGGSDYDPGKVSRPPKTAVPEVDPWQAPPAPAGPSGTVSSKQLALVNLLFGQCGITEREAKYDWLEEFTGRAVTSSKELTQAEASNVIRELKLQAAQVKAVPSES